MKTATNFVSAIAATMGKNERKKERKTSTATKGYIIRSTAYATLLLCVILGVCSAFDLSGKLAEPQRQPRTLTLADRVAYQRAIEEVYWRHRIWPKENAPPKPPLDAIISRAEIVRKVEGYLYDSQVLEDSGHRAISAEDLQIEMVRDPLHELEWNALIQERAQL